MRIWTSGPSMGWNTPLGFSQKSPSAIGHYHISKPRAAQKYHLENVAKFDLSKRESLGYFDDAQAAKDFVESAT